ncbi:MAG: vanadium-dependent haloperoxidase [Gemmatimonadaceae bacterium]
MTRRAFATLVLLGAALACDAPPRPRHTVQSGAERLHAAMRALTNVIVYDIFSPPQASRVYAYSSIAAYEVLRHGDSSYRSLAGQVNALQAVPPPAPNEKYDLPLAGVHAFMTVGRALTFSQARMDSLRAELGTQFRRDGISRAEFGRSVAYGERVAQHVLDWAATDGFKESRGYARYTVTPSPGRWIPTPPAYMDAVEPNWGTLRPFVMDSGSQFRPEPPVPFDTAQGSLFYRQVREVYDVGRTLTDEQRSIAAFWDCNPYVMHVQGHTMFATKKITPGGHWMGIVAIAARKTGADVVRSAEAYARTAIALADGFISSWEEKYRSNLVRPETIINRYIDEQWQPLLQTPPFPEYTSGHSVISNAAAAVLADQFGRDFAFADSTELDYGLPVRSFVSFEQAAQEAAMSRLYGGIHYRQAIEVGSVQGRSVGALVVQRVRTRPDTRVVTGMSR